MDADFFSYIDLLEMLAFFSGYPLIYFIVITIAGKKESRTRFKNLLIPVLTIEYAIVGTLYLGLQLKNLYPDYSLSTVKGIFDNPFFKTWALLALLFWLPIFWKKSFLCLLHSLPFFFILLRDIWQYINHKDGNEVVKNDMKLFTTSLLLNAAAFVACILISLFFNWAKRKPRQ